MSRLAFAFRRLIAVESFPVERHLPPPAAAPEPDAGARWGRPARFEFANPEPEPPAQAQIAYDWLDRARRLRGVESHREYVLAPASTGGVALAPEAIRSVTFFLGSREERHERREVKGGVTDVTPVVETIREYVRFDFPFGEAQGSRGEPHPPPTPPRQEPADHG